MRGGDDGAAPGSPPPTVSAAGPSPASRAASGLTRTTTVTGSTSAPPAGGRRAAPPPNAEGRAPPPGVPGADSGPDPPLPGLGDARPLGVRDRARAEGAAGGVWGMSLFQARGGRRGVRGRDGSDDAGRRPVHARHAARGVWAGPAVAAVFTALPT